MKRGWRFFSIAMDHPVHRRMAAVVRACSGRLPCGTRGIVEAVLGGREASLTRKQAYHLCERIICSAVSNGFVRRLPVRGVSLRRPSSRPDTVYKESLYEATDAGRFFLERHENMLRMAGTAPEARGRRGGERRNRSRTEARYRRRMRTGVPDGL